MTPAAVSAKPRGEVVGLHVDVGMYGNYSLVVVGLREGDWEPAFVRRYNGVIYGSSKTTSAGIGESLAGTIVRETVGVGSQTLGVRGSPRR